VSDQPIAIICPRCGLQGTAEHSSGGPIHVRDVTLNKEDYRHRCKRAGESNFDYDCADLAEAVHALIARFAVDYLLLSLGL
jgi:hypothetical protein